MKSAGLTKLFKHTYIFTVGTLIALASDSSDRAMASDDVLINKLEQKGILTVDEAKEMRAEAAAEQTNLLNIMPPSKWKMSDSIKSMQLYGDVRFRYEYRNANNVVSPTAPNYDPNVYYHSRERFRYALRAGVKGDLFDDFNYGIRLETSTNPRSPWDTFGNNGTGGSVTPSDKSSSGIYVGQLFLGWHPTDWYEMTVGRMPMPLYTTPMVWDSDINPEGAFEKFKYTIGDVDLFADFGQFDYRDPNQASELPSQDIFVLAWQIGANVKISKDMSFKVAPVVYTYTGTGSPNNPLGNGIANQSPSGGLNGPFVGQGYQGENFGVPGAPYSNLVGYNEEGLNNLLILEIPAEFDFRIWNSPVGTLQGRLFGDFAYNFQGNDRANAAYNANPSAFPGVGGPVNGQYEAYQVGIGVGTAGPVYGPTQGLVYGSTSKKNTWEARVYWQHVEQYALDVNLLDSDFFEGRANLEGIYSAFAYSFTDCIIGTIRYGYASQINKNLGTGGNNLDLPNINPINNYSVLQLDMTWRF
jgi:hypothetical protein